MKKNIVFYCHNFWWLWHTRRISLIVKEIINNFWDFYNVIFLNSWEIQDFLFNDIKEVKVINLPNYNFKEYQIIDWEKILKFRINLYKKLFSIWNIESLIIEHFPFWRNFLNEEINFLVKTCKIYNKKSTIFSSVRDIFDIKSLNNRNLLLFDRFLIHWDKKKLKYSSEFDFNIRKKIIYTWYVLSENNKIESKEKDYIYVSIWGWQDGIVYVLDFLLKYNKSGLNNKIYLTLWKSYNENNLNQINNIGIQNIIIKPYFLDFITLKNEAWLVVSMWWYNSFFENLFYNKKSIIYPRCSDNEQITRLELFKNWVWNIYDGRNITTEKIVKIISEKKQEKKLKLDFNWAFFSWSFIVNFNKYKYLKIRVTNICNIKCEMCGVIKRDKQSLNLLKLKQAILDFYKLWGEVINFTWWEPTIYNGFWDLLYLSKSLWLITSVSTNWTTFWEDFFEKNYKNNFKLIDYIDISIDWLYEKQDIIRNSNWLFEKIDKSIIKLQQNNIYTHINVTIRKDNIKDMKYIFNYLKEKKIPSISFWMIASDPLNDTTHLIPKKQDLKDFYLNEKKYIIENKNDIKVVFSPDYNWENLDSFISSIHKKNAFNKKNWEKCFFINEKKELRINEWWRVNPCCILDDFDENIGNVNEKKLLNIICSSVYEEFLNKKHPNISKACLNCKIWE